MDVREKLVGLLKNNREHYLATYITEHRKSYEEYTADHLIAHGVTVQELYGCEYCKEDSDGYRTMFGAFSITNPFHGNEWFINTGHCKPRQIYFCPMCGRKLPQPPKGE